MESNLDDTLRSFPIPAGKTWRRSRKGSPGAGIGRDTGRKRGEEIESTWSTPKKHSRCKRTWAHVVRGSTERIGAISPARESGAYCVRAGGERATTASSSPDDFGPVASSPFANTPSHPYSPPRRGYDLPLPASSSSSSSPLLCCLAAAPAAPATTTPFCFSSG